MKNLEEPNIESEMNNSEQVSQQKSVKNNHVHAQKYHSKKRQITDFSKATKKASRKIPELELNFTAAAKRRKEKLREKTSKDNGLYSEKNNPILHSTPVDNKKLPIPIKILGLLSVILSVVTLPFWGIDVKEFIDTIINGSISSWSTNSIVLYIVFLVSLFLIAIGFLTLGIYLLSNRRRLAAVLMNTLIAEIVVCSLVDVMLFGVKPDIIFLTLGVIILIALKSYVDPSLKEERKLQKKLQDMETRDKAKQGMLGRDETGKSYAELNYFNVLWIFTVCCVLGYIVEIIWHMTVDNPGVYQERAGFLFGPFSPIYGIGGILLTAFCNKMYNKNIIVIFIVSALVGGCFEYFASLFLEVAFGINSWDYSHLPFNINGRVSLRFFIMWGIFGVAFNKLAFKPLINTINKIPWKWRYGLTIILSVIIWTNAVMTLQALDCWYSRTAGKPVVTPIDQFYEKHFDDDFMKARFENMKLDPKNAVRSGNQFN